jgi:hypothetical protein
LIYRSPLLQILSVITHAATFKTPYVSELLPYQLRSLRVIPHKHTRVIIGKRQGPWVMMAEAFGLPILDHDNIPEPGYERKKDPIASVLDERLKEMEAGNVKGIPWEEVRKDLEAKCGPFDEEGYDKELEEERMEKEKAHGETFIGTSTFEELINKIYSDYREYLERDRIENPWKYRAENAEPSVPPDRRGKTPASR